MSYECRHQNEHFNSRLAQVKNKNMSDTTLKTKILELRKRKGFSQETLAEHSGLNLRTIQRIEKGETIPRGDSLRKLAQAFDVNSEELTDWTIKEDNGFLISLNISALTGLIFPVLGILLPLILWVQKKDKIQGVKKLGKSILNFQLTLTIMFFAGFLITVLLMVNAFDAIQEGSEATSSMIAIGIKNSLSFQLVLLITFNLFNIVMVLVNTIRLSKGKSAQYFPAIPFLKG